MATPTDENTRQFMIYAPDELVRAVKIAAASRDVTASALVRGILQEWLFANGAEAPKKPSVSRIANVQSSVS